MPIGSRSAPCTSTPATKTSPRSVAAIVRGIRGREGDIGQTAADWEMPEEAVRAAIAFYRRHREFIDARILLEDDWFDQDFRAR